MAITWYGAINYTVEQINGTPGTVSSTGLKFVFDQIGLEGLLDVDNFTIGDAANINNNVATLTWEPDGVTCTLSPLNIVYEGQATIEILSTVMGNFDPQSTIVYKNSAAPPVYTINRTSGVVSSTTFKKRMDSLTEYIVNELGNLDNSIGDLTANVSGHIWEVSGQLQTYAEEEANSGFIAASGYTDDVSGDLTNHITNDHDWNTDITAAIETYSGVVSGHILEVETELDGKILEISGEVSGLKFETVKIKDIEKSANLDPLFNGKRFVVTAIEPIYKDPKLMSIYSHFSDVEGGPKPNVEQTKFNLKLSGSLEYKNNTSNPLETTISSQGLDDAVSGLAFMQDIIIHDIYPIVNGVPNPISGGNISIIKRINDLDAVIFTDPDDKSYAKTSFIAADSVLHTTIHTDYQTKINKLINYIETKCGVNFSLAERADLGG